MSTNQQRSSQPAAAAGPAGGSSPAEEILARSQSSRPVIQEFVELAKSLEWQLGQQYLKERGSAAFTVDSSPVPFVVNNDGGLSRRAAEVFFESLAGSDQRSAVSDQQDGGSDDIYVLELGVGVGLFARFFLDHFRDLCRKHKKDYYDRLCYILADKSPRMLLDVSRHGILAGHAGRYRLRVVDALRVDEALPYDVAFSGQRSAVSQNQRFRAVFLNYLLDCLPAAVLEINDERGRMNDEQKPAADARPSPLAPDSSQVRLLHVRTCLARNVNLADHTDMTIEQLQERAQSSDRRAREELLEVYGLFASEYEYLPLGRGERGEGEKQGGGGGAQGSGQQGQTQAASATNGSNGIPHLDFALDFARKHAKRVLHSYGAIGCLEKLLGLVEDDGFILINDYGQAEIKADDDFEHQRFSLATFIGVNFPLLKAYFADGGEGEVGRIVYPSVRCDAETGRIDNPSYGDGGAGRIDNPSYADGGSQASELVSGPSALMHEPFGGDAGGIHSRLLSRGARRETVLRFQAVFGRAEYDRLNEPLNKAREAVKVGRFEAALSLYRQALERQPRNWVLLSEVSNFLTFSVRDPKAGADMAKLAIRLNPACSSDLWCTLGDALFEWGRTAEAKSAYLRALAINPGDVRGRFNLAFVHTRQKNYRPALGMIADALALDKTGQYRERLLAKQAEVLQLVAVKHQQEFLRMVNLVSKPEAGKKDEA